MNEPNFRACVAGLVLVACLGGIATETALKSRDAAILREERMATASAALDTLAKLEPRLVGLGCGPDRLTLVAVNEDDFPPPCDTVETPQNLCGIDDAQECADYMGQGY